MTLDFGSGHDLVVRGFEPQVRLCTDSVEPAWDVPLLPPCPSPTPIYTHTPSLKTNLKKKSMELEGEQGNGKKSLTHQTDWSLNFISGHTYCVTLGQQPNLSEPQALSNLLRGL